MKMDTVWQAKVADSAIEIEQVTLDVAGADSIFGWALGVSLAIGPDHWALACKSTGQQQSQRAQADFSGNGKNALLFLLFPSAQFIFPARDFSLQVVDFSTFVNSFFQPVQTPLFICFLFFISSLLPHGSRERESDGERSSDWVWRRQDGHGEGAA